MQAMAQSTGKVKCKVKEMFEKIVTQYSIEVVSNRTKISKKNLEKLMAGDFSGMTKPQAYGFLKILQREFGEDEFGDLKSQLDAWFSQSQPGESEIFVTSEPSEDVKGKRWIVITLAILVLLLGLYLIQKEFSGAPKQAVDMNATAGQTHETAPLAEAGKAATAEGTSEVTQTAGEASSIAEASAEMAEQPEAAAEPEKNVTEPYVPIENAVIVPRVKLWLGIIDLKTKRRVAKVTADSYEIESRGKKLLVTGHGRFEISDAFGNLFKFNDAKKHYFLIDDGMVKEIDFAEFKRLNGGKGW
jgi:hypothetical protein